MSPRCCKWWMLGVPPTWLVICGVVLVQVGFGLYPVVVKKLASTANPLVFSFYRDTGCFPVLFLCALIVERKAMVPGWRMWLVFMALGLTGMFASQLLYILGVYWAGPDIASAFQPAMPVWTAILAVLTCTEKMPSPLYVHSWIKLTGILLATGGAVELVLTGDDDSSDDEPTLFDANSTSSHPVSIKMLGYLSLVGNTFCTAVYLLIQKRFIFNKLRNKWRQYPIYVTAYSYLFGALFMGIGPIYYAAAGKFDQFSLSHTSAYALVYAVFITSATCYLLITWSNMHLSSTVVTAFWPLQVLVAVLAAYFITEDKLAPLQYVGAVMLTAALLLVLLANHMEERLQEKRPVLRVDCRMTRPHSGATDDDDKSIGDETRPLLTSTQQWSYVDLPKKVDI